MGKQICDHPQIQFENNGEALCIVCFQIIAICPDCEKYKDKGNQCELCRLNKKLIY